MDVRVISSLDEVAPEAWDALAGVDNPFVEHRFLRLLETSGSVGPKTGWVPLYLLVEDGKELVGACAAYLKDQSYGEYIFDWSWADASHRAGIPYYPKLVVAVPFTPATGPRLLVRPDVDRARVWDALVQGLDALMERTEAMSVHVLYCLDDEAAFLDDAGFGRRVTHQFHWRNPGYASFEDFLGALRSEPRKQLRKERRRVKESGIDVELVRGDTVSDDVWRTMYKLYISTSSRKWGSPYLTRAFFEGAKESIGSRVLLGLARRGGEIVAGTLSLTKGQHVYGRYWGAFEPVDNLHFELCYYQLLDYAIDNRLALVEAGAQGEHKVKRGFLPVITHSAHRFRHPALADAVFRLLDEERAVFDQEIAKWQAEGPFREDSLPDFPRAAGVPLPAPSTKT